MTSVDTQTPELDPVQRDNARVGYQVAASMLTYEGNLIWARFGAMLVAHSLIITAIGFVTSTSTQAGRIGSFGLPIVGIVLCAVWMILNQRGFGYHEYWILSMRELEELYLAPAVRTVSRGGDFADGKPVYLTINGAPKPRKPKRLARVPVALASGAIIVIFALLYIAFLVGAF